MENGQESETREQGESQYLKEGKQPEKKKERKGKERRGGERKRRREGRREGKREGGRARGDGFKVSLQYFLAMCQLLY